MSNNKFESIGYREITVQVPIFDEADLDEVRELPAYVLLNEHWWDTIVADCLILQNPDNDSTGSK